MRDGAFHYDHSVHVLDETQRCELAALAKNGELGACRTLHGASTIYAKKMEGAEQSDGGEGGEAGVADEVAANVRCFMYYFVSFVFFHPLFILFLSLQAPPGRLP